MKILCWNINSLPPTVRNAVLKYGSFKGLFDEYDADIVCLQETKVREDKLTKELVCVEGYQSFWSISKEKKGYSGVTTYAASRFAPLSCQLDSLTEGKGGEDELDREGRVVITDHGAFVLVNVYVPNAGDRPQRARLAAKLRFLEGVRVRCGELRKEGREVIIVGDFNVAASPRDVHPSINFEELYAAEELGVMRELLGSYTDIWRQLHPDTTDVYSVWDEYTNARAFNRGLRIDYFLCSPGLVGRVVSCEMVPTHPKWSDHTGMVLELRDVPPLPDHPPCPQWTKLLKRFHDSSQPSLLSMFGRKKGQGGGQGQTTQGGDQGERAAGTHGPPEAAAAPSQQPQQAAEAEEAAVPLLDKAQRAQRDGGGGAATPLQEARHLKEQAGRQRKRPKRGEGGGAPPGGGGAVEGQGVERPDGGCTGVEGDCKGRGGVRGEGSPGERNSECTPRQEGKAGEKQHGTGGGGRGRGRRDQSAQRSIASFFSTAPPTSKP